MAGYLGVAFGTGAVMVVMSAVAIISVVAASRMWPANTERALEHSHDDLPDGHPHLKDAIKTRRGWVHRHTFVIDDEHHVWPTSG